MATGKTIALTLQTFVNTLYMCVYMYIHSSVDGWTLRLFLCLGYCKQYGCKHKDTCIFSNQYFFFFPVIYPKEYWKFNLKATFLDIQVTVGELKIVRLRIL